MVFRTLATAESFLAVWQARRSGGGLPDSGVL
jgi:hypothetical protein